MTWKPDWEVRREGERVFEQGSWSGRNPYEYYGDYDERQRHQLWDDGYRYAARRDEERRQEEAAQEYDYRQRQAEQCQIEEDEYWDQLSAQEAHEQAQDPYDAPE